MMTTAVPAGIKDEYLPGYFRRAHLGGKSHFPGLQEHAVVERNCTSDAARIMGETALGISIAQAGAGRVDRPPIKTPLEGLYIVGAEAGLRAGIGLP